MGGTHALVLIRYFYSARPSPLLLLDGDPGGMEHGGDSEGGEAMPSAPVTAASSWKAPCPTGPWARTGFPVARQRAA